MRNRILTLVAALLLSLNWAWAVELDSLNRDTAYVASIVKRSEKIVAGLNVADSTARSEVVKIIANRYFQLNDIYSGTDKKEIDSALYRSHFAFPAALSLWLSPEQIEGVKDGMTFNVLNVTYAAHLDMIPTLKEDEKAQIYAWLVEAREYAMDAESAKKKHEMFGKYKGRINNYLTKQGYNLTKEREAWAERVKARGGTL
jgi:hypothetical protein